MEPSCLAVFKDELTKMLPHDDDARRLAANSYHFAEFFEAFDIQPPRLSGRALLWGHCHQRATGGIETNQRLLEKSGMTVENLSGGCCGLAGSWGFEDGKYGISLDCGEQALLPAVRDADLDLLVIADGFSCKTQIADAGTKRTALHTGQVLAASAEDGKAPGKPRPPVARRILRTVAPVLGIVAAAWGLGRGLGSVSKCARSVLGSQTVTSAWPLLSSGWRPASPNPRPPARARGHLVRKHGL